MVSVVEILVVRWEENLCTSSSDFIRTKTFPILHSYLLSVCVCVWKSFAHKFRLAVLIANICEYVCYWVLLVQQQNTTGRVLNRKTIRLCSVLVYLSSLLHG